MSKHETPMPRRVLLDALEKLVQMPGATFTVREWPDMTLGAEQPDLTVRHWDVDAKRAMAAAGVYLEAEQPERAALAAKFAYLVQAMKQRGYGDLYRFLMGESIDKALMR